MPADLFCVASGPADQGCEAPPPRALQRRDVARLTTELARQQQLLALLVDRVSAAQQPAPALPAFPTSEPARGLAGGVSNGALLEELRLIREVCMACQTGAPAPGSDPVDGDCQAGAQLPLARLAPPLSAFDPEGDVTQAGADSFWAWLDATPRTPWTAKAPYGEWAGKIQYKCSASELTTWVTSCDPTFLEADAGRRTKRELVDALVRACAQAARARASSGASGGAGPQPPVLQALLNGAGASQASS